MADIIALGCGLVGEFVVTKLAQQGYDVHAVDLKIPRSIKNNAKISYHEGDIFTILYSLPKTKVVLNLLPGCIGEQIRPELIKSGLLIIDLAFTEVEPTIHHSLALEHGSRLVWDVGIAPGLSNMIVRQEYERDSRIRDLTIKVGGNPVVPDSEWSYMAPFSPSDVIEEYTRPARIISQGKPIIVDALSDAHRIEVTNFGEMEAFLTDGLRSLLNTAFSPNMREYTVRWPGHIQKWQREKDQLSDSQMIEAWKFDEDRREFTWMEIHVSYAEYEVIWEIVDTGKAGHSSMARTTGLVTVACAIELINQLAVDSESIEYGVFAPEDLKLNSIDRVIKFLQTEGVSIDRQIKE
ncbi:MAG TPA: hypothetical protein HA354_06180 [Candidatus Poseidoniaceae archaeon]|nr:hypothetical protein [Euryarchaeota archaeon]DAC56996.1 MAG TPA: hypothetical protein D7I07_06155 [Candidatus Poseidoniales archaeon]HII38068.1 hypothetical protein [Candidatus Poseidoniaceae archaeon]